MRLFFLVSIIIFHLLQFEVYIFPQNCAFKSVNFKWNKWKIMILTKKKKPHRTHEVRVMMLVCVCVCVGMFSLIVWSKKLSKTHGTINLCYELILVHNGKFGQEHVNCQKLFINSSMICYMDLSCVFFLLFSLFLTFVLFHFLFLLFLLYESSPSSLYFVLVHLNNFWPYQALLSRFFIMNGDF